MILLDTSAYSAFMRGHARVLSTVQNADQIVLNPVVLGELKAGFQQGRRVQQNLTELETFLASPRVRIVDITAATADRYAAIVAYLTSAGTPVPTNDMWIAASGMEHGVRVVTTDGHYRKIPQVIVEYFEAEPS